ncbi:MAG: 30S ribosomal protein S1, partial [Clostridia bacterium]|nr:30S ribosomal protein S1 [Clostridia bacterium]
EQRTVVVKSIDYDSGRMYTSPRELFGTWEENASKFTTGQTVSGIIRSVEDYGVFVELTPNLAGLAELKDGVVSGQGCAVYIKSIVPEKMKIKLVIIDTYEAQLPQKRPEYFIDTDKVTHIDYWRYSPSVCDRVVETKFE